MDAEKRIQPDRITKPIQLLAAWLVGLIVVDGSFLIAAGQMGATSWERGALVIAAIVNVPLFLFALFLLQTRFRPELQEDSYYAQYLDKRTNQVVTIRRDEIVEKELSVLRSEIRRLAVQRSVPSLAAKGGGVNSSLRVGLNRHMIEARGVLKEASIPVVNVFGTKDAPSNRLIVLGGHVPFTDKVALLRLAEQMKMDGYAYFTPAEEDIEEDVLIGAYGTVEYRVTPALTSVLSDDPEPIDLSLYEEEHRVSS